MNYQDYEVKVKKHVVAKSLMKAIKIEHRVDDKEAIELMVTKYRDLFFELVDDDIKDKMLFLALMLLCVWCFFIFWFKFQTFFGCLGILLIVYASLKISAYRFEKETDDFAKGLK